MFSLSLPVNRLSFGVHRLTQQPVRRVEHTGFEPGGIVQFATTKLMMIKLILGSFRCNEMARHPE